MNTHIPWMGHGTETHDFNPREGLRTNHNERRSEGIPIGSDIANHGNQPLKVKQFQDSSPQEGLRKNHIGSDTEATAPFAATIIDHSRATAPERRHTH